MLSRVYVRSVSKYSDFYVLSMIDTCANRPSTSEHVSDEVPLRAFTNGDSEVALSQAGRRGTSEHLSTCTLN